MFWHEPTRRWVMAVSLGDEIGLFASTDLLDWEELSRFGAGHGLHSAVWECPDLFPLRVDGDPDQVRWVLTVSVGASDATDGSTAQYFVGDFDGTTFVRDPAVPPEEVQQTDVGQDFYAAQSYEQAPDGRRVWIGWMGNWRYPYSAPTHPWTNAMSVPRDLGLRTVDGQVRLVQAPVPELGSLRGEPTRIGPRAFGSDTVLPLTGATFELETEIETRGARRVSVRLLESRDADGRLAGGCRGRLRRRAARHGSHSRRDHRLRCPTLARPTNLAAASSGSHVLVDESSVEVFVDDGALTGTMVVFPKRDGRGCRWPPRAVILACAS